MIDVIRSFSCTITRPANTTAYSAGDVIADVSAALSKFTGLTNYSVIISNLRAQTDDTGLAGKTINVHFYNDTVTAQADNAAYSVTDPAKRVGHIALTFGSGNLASVASDQFCNLTFNPVGDIIPIIVESVAGHTPSANSTVLRIYGELILTN